MTAPQESPERARERRFVKLLVRRSLLLVILLVVAGWLADALLLQGLWFPVRIAGGSMAPRLQGDRWQVACGECDWPFAVGMESTPSSQRAVCPNCGFRDNDLRQSRQARGERVLIDKISLALQEPRRWDVVAVRSPLAREGLAVKRIVALPGERVEIRGGQVYINNQLLRKSLTELQQLQIPVYDDRFRPRSKQLPARWRAEDEQSNWQTSSFGFTYQPASSIGQTPDANARQASSTVAVANHGASLPGAAHEWAAYDWLSYRQLTCADSPRPRKTERPVMDTYGWNQNLSREIQPVTDLSLQGKLKLSPQAKVAFSLQDGRDLLLVTLSAGEAKLSVWQNEFRLQQVAIAKPITGWTRFVVAVCDRQLLVKIGEQTASVVAYQPSDRPRSLSARPIRVGVSGGEAALADLEIFRDLHYLGLHGSSVDWSLGRPLAEGELLLLGDNSPVSVDSRNWTVNQKLDKKLPKPRLLGRVISLR